MKIGIVGYGNLGKGVESAIKDNSDMELVGIFTRRDPNSVQIRAKGVNVYSLDDAIKMKDDIDVMILCGGSVKDLPTLTPQLAEHFNVIDSFDTHKKIPEHFEAVNKSATNSGKVAIISVGWDPGLFSLNRLISNSILPNGKTYTFWGKGVSQGHSDALRRVEGVKDAKQYTIPSETALQQVRSSKLPSLTPREGHKRECFVVAEEGADKARIEQEIKNMPNYFADYDTTVHFITAKELNEQHSAMPHGGFVIHSGTTGYEQQNNQVTEFSLKLDSNPEFTGSILAAYARAAFRAYQRGERGCKTVFDVAAADLSCRSYLDIISELL